MGLLGASLVLGWSISEILARLLFKVWSSGSISEARIVVQTSVVGFLLLRYVVCKKRFHFLGFGVLGCWAWS
jgi:hypothetical protein